VMLVGLLMWARAGEPSKKMVASGAKSLPVIVTLVMVLAGPLNGERAAMAGGATSTPICARPHSVNQRLPSGPAAMKTGPLRAVGMGNSWATGAGLAAMGRARRGPRRAAGGYGGDGSDAHERLLRWVPCVTYLLARRRDQRVAVDTPSVAHQGAGHHDGNPRNHPPELPHEFG
jgi:hypothetical protein